MSNGNVQTGQLVNQSAGDLVAEGKTLQQIQTPYATAVKVQVPRDLEAVYKNCLAEAQMAGDLFYYHWEVTSTDKKTGDVTTSIVEGPSYQCVLAAARMFGNLAIVQKPIQETRSGWIFTAALIDHETGFTFERQFRMSKKAPVYGKADEYRKDDIRFQIGQSKAIRNLGPALGVILDKMVEMAKDSVRVIMIAKVEKAEKSGGGILDVINAMLVEFKRLNVESEMLERKLSMPMTKWNIDDITLLAGDMKAIKKGTETVQSLYGNDNPEEPANDSDGKSSISTADMKTGKKEDHQAYANVAPEGNPNRLADDEKNAKKTK